MNITLIFGPLAFLSILYTSVQGIQKPGPVWPLAAAEVGNETYTLQVSLETKDGGKTYLINAVPKNSASNVPKVVYGPFALRGSGPYSMMVNKVWLNTNGGEKDVNVTFNDAATAWGFYRILNPHHSPSFRNEFKIKLLVLDSLELDSTLAFEANKPKALDIFKLETSAGADSKARRYVVHNMEGDQEPIMIFHSFEHEMAINGDTILLTISPHNSGSKYVCSIKLQNAYAANNLLKMNTVLNSQGLQNNLQELEVLSRNTYPIAVNA